MERKKKKEHIKIGNALFKQKKRVLPSVYNIEIAQESTGSKNCKNKGRNEPHWRTLHVFQSWKYVVNEGDMKHNVIEGYFQFIMSEVIDDKRVRIQERNCSTVRNLSWG